MLRDLRLARVSRERAASQKTLAFGLRLQTTMRLRVALLNRLGHEAAQRGLTRSALVEQILIGFVLAPEDQREARLWDRETPIPSSAEDILS